MDEAVLIEEVAGVMQEGKLTHWGLSEALFPMLEELNIGYVAFSPLANGFLPATDKTLLAAANLVMPASHSVLSWYKPARYRLRKSGRKSPARSSQWTKDCSFPPSPPAQEHWPDGG